MSNPTQQPVDSPVEPFSPRERDVLALLSQGFSSPEIAGRLSLAPSTVKWYLRQLYLKLGVNNKQKAILRAAALGLLTTLAVAPSTPPGLWPDLQAAPTPVAPSSRHNLPVQLTKFVGRAQQLAEVRQQLRENRLLTLIGTGGTGKTRLALQAAAAMLDDFPDGVWLAAFAPIASPGQVPQAVAQALALHTDMAELVELEVADGAARDALSLVIAHLRERTLLLILDNCEHLLSASAELAEQLLRAAPGLRILATSREALRVLGEHSLLVPGLGVPAAEGQPELEAVAQSEAGRLFVERAQAVRPDFALTAANAPAVAQICRRLNGIPLALELAAARAQALPAEQIAAHLDDRFRLLTSGGRTAPRRQQTLRGAIDWSYELLSEAERALLQRMAVFAGGWELEAAEAVAGGPNVLDDLTQLVAKSLVLSEQTSGQAARFQMLETIREYAQEKLRLSGEAEAARGRHLSFYIALAEQAALGLPGSGQQIWLNRVDHEIDNLRGALAHAITTEDAEAAQRLAGALNYFWRLRGYEAEGRHWLEAALALARTSDALQSSTWQARALLGAGRLGMVTNPASSQAWLEEALEIYRAQADKAGMAEALYCLAGHRIASQKDYVGAFAKYQAALELWMAAENEWGVGYCLHWMGHALEEMGERSRAREFYGRSVEVLRDVGDPIQLSAPLNDLAGHAWGDGDSAGARAMLTESLQIFEAQGSLSGKGMLLNLMAYISTLAGDYPAARMTALAIQNVPGRRDNPARGRVYLGQIDYLQGHLAEAQSHFEAAHKLYLELAHQIGIDWVAPWLACIAYRLGELERAKLLIHTSQVVKDPDKDWVETRFALLNRGDVARAQGDSATAAESYARSLRLVVRYHIQPEVADRLEGFAKLAAAAQQPERAARLFGAAAGLRERIGTPVAPVERADYDRALEHARAQLALAAFSAAWDEGLSWTWKQAAAYALNV